MGLLDFYEHFLLLCSLSCLSVCLCCFAYHQGSSGCYFCRRQRECHRATSTTSRRRGRENASIAPVFISELQQLLRARSTFFSPVTMTKGNKREREPRHGTTVVLCRFQSLTRKHLWYLSFGTIEQTHFERASTVVHTHSTHLRHRRPSAGPFAAVAPWLSGSVFLYVTDCLSLC